jgi:hypothetical protein
MIDYRPPDIPLDILHEDHEILVVNKPEGLLSVPGKGPELADCLIARLEAAYPQVLLVHRLDRDTSGVMVRKTANEENLSCPRCRTVGAEDRDSGPALDRRLAKPPLTEG